MQSNPNIYFICFISLIAARNFLELFVKPKKKYKYELKRKGAISLILFVISYLASGISVGIFLLLDSEVNSYIYVIGAFVFIFAYLGRTFALRKIGDSYSQFIEPVPGSPFITSGIYSVIRHPLYMFYALEMVGLVTIRFNHISLSALIITMIVTLYRVGEEELLLYNRFGEDFANYQKRTKKLIPFVY